MILMVILFIKTKDAENLPDVGHKDAVDESEIPFGILTLRPVHILMNIERIF